MNEPLKLSHRLFYYIIIGGSAALVNLIMVFLQVEYLQVHPLLANIIAFLTAFNVSYFGHKHLTFANIEQKQLSLPHFFLVASTALAINESLYFLFLKCTSLNYLIALSLVLILVSIYSFILSRFWACR